MARRFRVATAVLGLLSNVIAFLAAGIAASAAAQLAWQPYVRLAGVFDLAGPRSDGQLVVNGGKGLYLLSPDGTLTPFAQGSGGYGGAGGSEAYLDVSPGLHVSAANCSFARDEAYIIRPSSPFGVTRIDGEGHASNFTTLTGIDSLNGIVFDRTGDFDHRLLVTGPHGGKTVVFAIDCTGHSDIISRSAPTIEGGLAVAPSSFGAFAGDLVAPDELRGPIWAIDPAGKVTMVLQSTIRHGQDTGVESEGFVPAGFFAGGWAYVADRATANNPHPGSDTILRIADDQLQQAGVQEGDLLVAAEGGGVMIDVRCQATCRQTTIVAIETKAHIEGHVLLALNASLATPTPTPPPTPLASATAGPIKTGAAGVRWLLPAALAMALIASAAVTALVLRRR